MGNTLTTAERADILDAATGLPLSNARYIYSLDVPEPATVAVDPDNNLDLVGQSEGTVVLTITDTVTNSVATLEVAVTAAPFAITLGTPEPK